jgi:ATP-dependent DNA helicase RecG
MGASRAAKLAAEGIRNVGDFLLALPFRYEDRSRYATVGGLAAFDAVTLRVKLTSVKSTRMRRGTLRIEAVADDGTGAIRVVWHNRYPSFAKGADGASAVIYGTATVGPAGELRIENPETEFLPEDGDADPVHSGRIVGIYHRAAGISTRPWRTLARRALDRLGTDWRGASAESATLARALESAHFPASLDDAETARCALGDEELLALAGAIEAKRARLRERSGIVLDAESVRADAGGVLPFRLTGAQRRAVREIAGDLSSGRAMARLLQGDVGSGKTVVAGLAFWIAARGGVQSALMAPTEILAEQHAESLASWLEPAGMRLGLLTGRVRGRERKGLLTALEAGEVDLLVGTHALVESPVKFRRLALVVVDEQHRFGVAHRSRLFRKGESPHVLVMTATPIPRSLAWAIYGELDLSVLDEKPPGRPTVATRVREASEHDRSRIYRFAAERVRAGERVYVVVPAIEEGEREVAATAETAARIAAAAPGVAVGVLHGRLAPEDRDRVLADFASGAVGILVSTTVVEVGVDVPEATFMVIENAEAFGLAQLHQLRGRVGRSDRPSWCALVVGAGASEEARSRLAILEETSDGFAIAERDLAARGPGDLLGVRQSGLPSLRVADPLRDLPRLELARREARRRAEAGERIESDLFPETKGRAGAVVKQSPHSTEEAS